MEQFQSRVQQNVNLADDELLRLANYLSTLKGDIADTKDQLNRVSLKTTQLQQELSGRDKRHVAGRDMSIARCKAKHHTAMQELQERQAHEIGRIHQDFEDKIAEIEILSKVKIQRKTGLVEELISKAQMQIKRLMEMSEQGANAMEEETPEDIQELQKLENQRQQRLEKVMDLRNKERLDSLLQAKTRLSDCIATLEEMERNHASNMENYKKRLEAIDARYNQRRKIETEKQERAVDSVKRKYADLERRAMALQKTTRKIERHHKGQILDAVREGEMLKMSVETTEAKSVQVRQGNQKVQALTQKRNETRKRLEVSENGLMQARTDNEALKREIARLKHEAIMAKRRPVL